MARKGNNPDRTDTEKETGSKRRYQSPQTPPPGPRSSPRPEDGREQGREQQGSGQRSGQEGRQHDGQDFETGGYRDGQTTSRGPDQQDWDDEGGVDGRLAGRGSDFDLQKASRDELNAIARELDIEDFETMNREELMMEIRERS